MPYFQVLLVVQGMAEDYLPLVISNLLVIFFFLFFLKSKKKASSIYKDRIIELEARSLRAQMNPHFIFNALNSIQSVMILKGEIESNRYIGLLSKLLRFTLELSSKESISLKQEIDYIEAYLGLQKMRLNTKMDFIIHNQLKKKLKEYKLPPMLIQPIVENSILHGISPLKDREGQIEIFLNEKENYLNITVKDNGIGIKASQKLKRQNNKTDQLHKSYATQILKERIDVFNYLKNKKMKFKLYEEKGTTIGTTAHLEIPKY